MLMRRLSLLIAGLALAFMAAGPRAVARADLVFIDIDQCFERRLIDKPLLD